MFTGKFRLDSLKHVSWSSTVRVAEFTAVTGGSPENDAYHKYTPAGNVSITVDNPAVEEQLELGKEYKLTFTKVT